MKKTLVALAVAAVAATSANAAVVYDQDGSKVEVGGSVRLLLQKETDKRTDLKNSGSRITVNASQDLGSGLSAIGQLEVRPDFDSSVKTARLWAGFKQDGIGRLTFGKQLTTGDEVGVSDYTYNLGGINKVTDSGDKVVHFRSDTFGGFGFGADYLFGSSAKATDLKDKDGNILATKNTKNNNGYVVGAFYNNKFGDLGVKFDIGYSLDNRAVAPTVTAEAKSYKEKGFTTGLELSYDKFSIGVDYAQRKTNSDAYGVTYRVVKKDDGKATQTQFGKIREIELGVKYQYLENASVYGEYIWGKATKDVDGDEDVKLNAWILGADYKIHKNVVTYLEGGSFKYKGVESKNKTTDNKIGVGLRVFF
ncbi:porin [Testudinibacter sp. TR-2022]|uniref:porin n=1 Tax=Testudinibacter sp. TR-2022 TaxID=2585029 RepID=UPI001119FB32|nr:porin [Testudinibacter sp. TR-2022]TNH03416.1 porin [Pasteurellaceae bacterium Phil11]TNH21069.1 porin [Testudinibacter sp. TR-2022]TNH27169.1 porin [Testudinibacter sp. TR-2022]